MVVCSSRTLNTDMFMFVGERTGSLVIIESRRFLLIRAFSSLPNPSSEEIRGGIEKALASDSRLHDLRWKIEGDPGT